MSIQRFVLEGEWSGYTSSQRKIVHRTVVTDESKYKNLQFIRYSDGTCLYLSLRPCSKGERIMQLHGYDSLIEDCIHHNVNAVADLPSD